MLDEPIWPSLEPISALYDYIKPVQAITGARSAGAHADGGLSHQVLQVAGSGGFGHAVKLLIEGVGQFSPGDQVFEGFFLTSVQRIGFAELLQGLLYFGCWFFSAVFGHEILDSRMVYTEAAEAFVVIYLFPVGRFLHRIV